MGDELDTENALKLIMSLPLETMIRAKSIYTLIRADQVASQTIQKRPIQSLTSGTSSQYI
jgi:hypothetical protein